MRREARILVVSLCAAVFTASLCGGATKKRGSSSNGSLRIAVVDLEKVQEKYESFRKAQEALDDESRAIKTSLEAKQKELNDILVKLQSQMDVLSAEAKQAKGEEFRRRYEEVTREYSDREQEIRDKAQDLLDRFQKKLEKTAETIAKEKGFDLVMIRAGLLYRSAAMDITPALIERLNKDKD